MSVAISACPILFFLDNAGRPAAGGSLLTQVGGVNFPTYQDPLGATPFPNPIPLNSRGEISNSSGISSQLFLTNSVVYTFTLFDAAGNQLWTSNNNIALSPVSTGNMTDARWIAGASYTNPSGNTPGTFVPGTTTTFTLPIAPGAIPNIWPFFDVGYQISDQISSLNGTTLVFTSPVPVGTQEVLIKIGSAYAIGTPSNGTVGAQQLAFLIAGTTGQRPVGAPDGWPYLDFSLGPYGQGIRKSSLSPTGWVYESGVQA